MVSMVANVSGSIFIPFWENIPQPSTKPLLSGSSRKTSTNSTYFCSAVWVVKQTVTRQLNKPNDTEFNTLHPLHKRMQWDKEVSDTDVKRKNELCCNPLYLGLKKLNFWHGKVQWTFIPFGNSGNIHLAHPYTWCLDNIGAHTVTVSRFPFALFFDMTNHGFASYLAFGLWKSVLTTSHVQICIMIQ